MKVGGYVALVHKDRGTSYGVSFPDVPGCISGGDTLEEALANAAEALAGHFALIRADGETEPKARPLAKVLADERLADDLADAIVRMVAPREPLKAVESSAVRGVDYDETRRELRVRFRGGMEYVYLNVPSEEFSALSASQSKGKYVAEKIKPRYGFRRSDVVA